MENVIILGGSGGSGRSTLAKQLGSITGMRSVYGGLRKVAREVGFGEYDEVTGKTYLTEERLVDFQTNYIPHHPEVHLRLDAHLFEEAHLGNVIVESMTLAPLSKRLGLSSLKVWIQADPLITAQRISKRENSKGETIVTPEQMLVTLNKRIEDNRKRYEELYGFNFLDVSTYYDFVFDTTDLIREDMGATLVEQLMTAGLWNL